jgi:hypothetical protein
MENHNQKSTHDKAFQLLGGMMNSFVLSALIKNGVIEALNSGIETVVELSEKCNVNLNVLSRTLRFAGFIGLVSNSENRYSLTDVGKCFLKDTPGSLYGSANFIGAAPWRDSGINFEHCLKTGEPAFNHVFGKPFFQFLESTPEYGMPFHQYMTIISKTVAPLISKAYDFGKFSTVCDVGGGQGFLLKSILEENPAIKGILFDLESASKEHFLGDIAERVEIITGSFFDAVPPADCLILKTIIHDWNDENSIKILKNCRQSLNQNGKILLIEQVLEEPFNHRMLFYDLHMQVMLGGAERTKQEFESLLESAGLKLERIIPASTAMKLIVASVS